MEFSLGSSRAYRRLDRVFRYILAKRRDESTSPHLSNAPDAAATRLPLRTPFVELQPERLSRYSSFLIEILKHLKYLSSRLSITTVERIDTVAKDTQVQYVSWFLHEAEFKDVYFSSAGTKVGEFIIYFNIEFGFVGIENYDKSIFLMYSEVE